MIPFGAIPQRRSVPDKGEFEFTAKDMEGIVTEAILAAAECWAKPPPDEQFQAEKARRLTAALLRKVRNYALTGNTGG